MRLQTLPLLICPKVRSKKTCRGGLKLLGTKEAPEILQGFLQCQQCKEKFPIIEGVVLLVSDVEAYIYHHIKGISQLVDESKIPSEYLKTFKAAKKEISVAHIEEDLESERVVALYFMNHYLEAKKDALWWQPKNGKGSPLLGSLIAEYWDHGPFSKIEEWVKESTKISTSAKVIELGCGVGGLYDALKSKAGFYLGVDNSFASIALARHLNLKGPYAKKIKIPADLLLGGVSREIEVSPQSHENLDFIVADFENTPVKKSHWDLAISLNAIDMMDDPALLPHSQYELLHSKGLALQSCPYIWHEKVSQKIRKQLPPQISDSARAVEWLYQQEGFKIERSLDHLPWLFFKHLRQLEIYSVHLFMAQKI